jgi:hypothetical protein
VFSAFEIKSESNQITEEQRNSFKVQALLTISITLSRGRKGSGSGSLGKDKTSWGRFIIEFKIKQGWTPGTISPSHPSDGHTSYSNVSGPWELSVPMFYVLDIGDSRKGIVHFLGVTLGA